MKRKRQVASPSGGAVERRAVEKVDVSADAPRLVRWNELRGQDRKASEKWELKLAKDAVCTQERCVECKYPMWTRDVTREDTCEECMYRLVDELANMEVKNANARPRFHNPAALEIRRGNVSLPSDGDIVGGGGISPFGDIGGGLLRR